MKHLIRMAKGDFREVKILGKASKADGYGRGFLIVEMENSAGNKITKIIHKSLLIKK